MWDWNSIVSCNEHPISTYYVGTIPISLVLTQAFAVVLGRDDNVLQYSNNTPMLERWFNRLVILTASLFNCMGWDGMKHFIISSTLTALLALILPWWVAGLVVFVVWMAKEVLEARTAPFEWHDMACNLIGIIIGIL